MLLDSAERPQEPYAKWAAASALREAYTCFARWTAGAAAVMWGASAVLSFFGVQGTHVS